MATSLDDAQIYEQIRATAEYGAVELESIMI